MSTSRLGTAILVAASLMAISSTLANAACGDRGGPGYRGPDGRCLSWESLGRKCGSPPTTGCTPENVHPESGDGARDGKNNQDRKDRAHDAIGVR
jgi:hypothetical protein